MLSLGKGRKRMKKTITAVLLIAALLSGCSMEQASIEGKKEIAQTCAYEKHLDLSIAYWEVDKLLTNAENDEVLRTIEDKFNVTLKPANITWDDYYQKMNLWADTGTLPDLFVGAFRTEASFYKWAKEGLLHEIPQDLSKYPNLEEYMDSEEKETCQMPGDLEG